MIKILLIFNLFQASRFVSIHEIEYKKHLKEATWTEISNRRLPYTPFLPRRKGLKKLYYGYLPYWVDTLDYRYFQMELISHIAYFSVGISPGTGSLGSIPNADRFYKIRDYAHPRGVKVNMTFTIFGTSNVSDFLNNPSARQNAILAIKDFVTNYGVDGVNIDFEFVTSSVKDSFSKFINDLAYELWNHTTGHKELFIAMPAVPEWYPGYNYSFLSSHSDGLFVMAYDFHYGGSSVAGPVSPTVPSSFWGNYSVAKTIGSYKAYGADPAKIIIGVPYYGYDWPTESDEIGSNTTGYGSAVIYRYAFTNAYSYGRRWDSYSLTPWYAYSTSGIWHQCWYDDSVSLDLKFSMVNDSGLLGAGCWALGYDGSYTHIWSVIRKNFYITPPRSHWVVEVNTEELNVREGPGVSYPVITTVHRGEKLVAFDYTGNWYKIYFPSGEGHYYGWCYGGDGITYKYLKGSTGDTTVLINASLLNVREGPGTSYNIITEVTCCQVFVADSFSDNWARIYLPDISGHTQGWLSLHYADLLPMLEDSNEYNCEIKDLVYPEEATSGDTFTLILKVFNSGFAPFDSLIYLRSRKGIFYDPENWIDSQRCRISGYNGLPNQTFYLSAHFKVPSVSNDTVLSDTFVFERKNDIFGPYLEVSLNVHAQNIQEKIQPDVETQKVRIPNIVSKNISLSLPEKGEKYTISLFDINGRLVFSSTYAGGKKITISPLPKKGIYILTICPLHGKPIRKKVLKIE